jgi:GNAT superfamily N-acetyltransferase
VADKGGGSAGGGIGSAGLGVIAAKLQRRLWSSHTTIAVTRDLAGTEGTGAGDDLAVAFEDPATFETLPRLLVEATGADYLQARAIERTREAKAGSLSVGRNAAGDVVAFMFVHEPKDHDALEAVAPGMYPRLQEGEVLTRTVFCLPEWRGRGYESRVLLATADLLVAQGKQRAWAYLDTTSGSDLRVFQAAGYAPSGQERVDSYRLGRYSNAFRPVTAASRAAWDSATR